MNKIFDFNKPIWQNKTKNPFLVAHRGVCGANVPCNTLTAFNAALNMGADVVELDISISSDGELFVFHPGMEGAFLPSSQSLSSIKAKDIEKLYLLNQDNALTSYKIPTLYQVLDLLKDKVYINLDKFWTDIPKITKVVREMGCEKQVIIKTTEDESYFAQIEKYAADLMYMPIISKKDELTKRLAKRDINLIGAEILFEHDNMPIISDEYIANMHERKLLLWANSIVYNENSVIAANHTDDTAIKGDLETGWGFYLDKKIDFIQTDWLLALANYINNKI